jgi:SAM-dependent methyltransferase
VSRTAVADPSSSCARTAIRRASAIVTSLEFTELVLSHLPPPPVRVLEIGCGRGELALALDARGYEIVAVDPEAPDGGIFRRTTIEELDEPGPFDVAIASFSLHHVADLDVVVDKVAGLLAPEGTLIMDDFGWDLLDGATAARYGIDLREWEEEHDDLHRYRQLRDALERRFVESHFSWEPYFSRHLDADAAEERELIGAGKILPLGFRFVGRRR